MRYALGSSITLLACLLLRGSAAASPDPGFVLAVEFSEPGMSATEIDQAAAPGLTIAFKDLAGLEHTESTARAGHLTMVLRFNSGDEAAAAQAVMERLGRAATQLPASSMPPELRHGDPATLPRYIIAVQSETLPLTALSEFARTQLSEKLSQLPGVRWVRGVGRFDRQSSIELDPARLAATAATPADVERALAATVKAAGKDKGPTPLELKDLVVRIVNGMPVRLADVGTVEANARLDGFARINGAPAVLVAVYAAATGPSADDIRKVLTQLAPQLPPATKVVFAADLGRRALVIDVRLAGGPSREIVSRTSARIEQVVNMIPERAACIAYASDEPDACSVLITGRLPEELPDRLRKQIARVDNASACVRETDPATLLRIALCGPDSGQLAQWGTALLASIKADPLALDPIVLDVGSEPTAKLVIDQDMLAKLGIAAEEATAAARWVGSGIAIPDADSRRPKLVIKPPSTAMQPEQLVGVCVRSGSGAMVPLSTFTKMTTIAEAASIFRVNGQLAILIETGISPGSNRAAAIAKCLGAATAEREKLGLPQSLQAVDVSIIPAK